MSVLPPHFIEFDIEFPKPSRQYECHLVHPILVSHQNTVTVMQVYAESDDGPRNVPIKLFLSGMRDGVNGDKYSYSAPCFCLLPSLSSLHCDFEAMPLASGVHNSLSVRLTDLSDTVLPIKRLFMMLKICDNK